jgi:hypothetical protein
MKFMGRKLTKKEEENAKWFLKRRVEDIIDDIDYHTDGDGRIILTDQRELMAWVKTGQRGLNKVI